MWLLKKLCEDSRMTPNFRLQTSIITCFIEEVDSLPPSRIGNCRSDKNADEIEWPQRSPAVPSPL